MNARSRTERSTLRNRRRGTEVLPVRRPAPDLSIYKPEQVAKAAELIAEGAIVPLRSVIFLAVSSDGRRQYRTAPGACTCPAGIRGVRCYHTAAARILLADAA